MLRAMEVPGSISLVRSVAVALTQSRTWLLTIVLTVSACDNPLSDARPQPYVSPVHGLGFGPFVGTQDPTLGAEPDSVQIADRLSVIAPHTRWVRTYGAVAGLERIPPLARARNLRVAHGAWIERDRAANDREIAGLIAAALDSAIDVAIVGNEVLLRRDLTELEVISYLDSVRRAIPASIPVTTAETCEVLQLHPSLLDHVDVVFVNHHPYHQGHEITCAVASLDHCVRRLQALAPARPVLVSETGWPTCGATIGAAVPSVDNARRYLIDVQAWSRATDTPVFYFEAFDEAWKARYEGVAGACWGIWDANGQLKPRMQDGFRGLTALDAWGEVAVPGGPGTPTVEFTDVPVIGSTANLHGLVLHAAPLAHRIAVYIYVSGWWTKPYFDRPTTSIGCDGAWEADVTTGGIDERATRIAAFLIPEDYRPPLLAGAGALPPALTANAVASVQVNRASAAWIEAPR
jgi:exo-beta-1,3-glucanase (GH17 family)